MLDEELDEAPDGALEEAPAAVPPSSTPAAAASTTATATTALPAGHHTGERQRGQRPLRAGPPAPPGGYPAATVVTGAVMGAAPALPQAVVLQRDVCGNTLDVTAGLLCEVLSQAACIANEPIDVLLDEYNRLQAGGTWGDAAPRTAVPGDGPQLSALGASGLGRAYCWSVSTSYLLTCDNSFGGAYEYVRTLHKTATCANHAQLVRWWLFPLLAGGHWSLAVVDPTNRTVHYYDALIFGARTDAEGRPNAGAVTDARLRRLGRWCDSATITDVGSWTDDGNNDEPAVHPEGAAAGPDLGWTIVRHGAGVPQQADSTSCGAYIAMYACSILQGGATPGQGDGWITAGDVPTRTWMHAELQVMAAHDASAAAAAAAAAHVASNGIISLDEGEHVAQLDDVIHLDE